MGGFCFICTVIKLFITKSFSRKIMWLEASSSNNNPKFIAHHYLQCVKENTGILYNIAKT